MLVTVRDKFTVRIAEVYFADSLPSAVPDADVAVYLQLSRPVEGCRPFRTIHVDLGKSGVDLFADLISENRQKIRRAQRDGIGYSLSMQPTDLEIGKFADFYDRFAAAKGLPLCNRVKLAVLRDRKGLALSEARDSTGVLCRHANIVDGIRARGLYSASLFRLEPSSEQRNYLGRASRYLNWMNILSFKELGLKIYDLGGLAMDETNPALANINSFKRHFGGREVTEYTLIKPQTLMGRLACAIQTLRAERKS